jgi:hypothetical protein
MFRKSTLIAVPAMAFALTLFASMNSTSPAFAKGGMGGPKGKPMGMNREHRGNWRGDFRYGRSWDRFGFGYAGFGCVEAPCAVAVVEPAPVVVAPVVETPVLETAVVTTPVVETPVCTTCEPVYGSFGVYGAGWGYRQFRDGGRRERPLERGGRMGGGHGRK